MQLTTSKKMATDAKNGTCSKRPMQVSLEGKRVLVTGAGRGIGREISLQLASAGAYVIGLGTQEEYLQSLKSEIGGDYVVCDLQDAKQTQSVIEKCGRIDCLVNNAGVARLAPFLETSVEDFDFVMNVNCRAAFVVGQAAAKTMVKTGGGTIVNVSSQAAERCLKDHTAYCTSKAAMNMLTKMMAFELGPKVRVNAVLPTVVMTDMGKKAWPPEKAAPMLARIPLGKFAEPSDVANLVLYLLSEKSDMINGATIPLEGGFYVA